LGRGPEAVDAFNRVLEPVAATSNDFRLRAMERDRIGDKVGALADFTEALKRDPKSSNTLARRGWGLLNSAPLALEDFDQAIQLSPDRGDLYNGRGYARVLLGRYRDAVADAEEALSHDTPSAQLPERLALRSNAACIYSQAAGRASADTASVDHE